MNRLPHGAKACRNNSCPDNDFKTHSCKGYTTAREKHKTIVATAKNWKCNDELARFHSLINKMNGCWLWAGQTTGKYSHPYYNRNGVSASAARTAYEMYGDKIPQGKRLMRTCDNPLCIMPSHHEVK
jgi:hypothetical protein